MKYDAQDCFHVSAPEADAWKRAVGTPRETVMMTDVTQMPQSRKNIFGTLQSRND